MSVEKSVTVEKGMTSKKSVTDDGTGDKSIGCTDGTMPAAERVDKKLQAKCRKLCAFRFEVKEEREEIVDTLASNDAKGYLKREREELQHGQLGQIAFVNAANAILMRMYDLYEVAK